MYRHHLEQMYKLCRPCQAAVEYYIKHQNRQLRALLLSHQFRRREADQAQVRLRPSCGAWVCREPQAPTCWDGCAPEESGQGRDGHMPPSLGTCLLTLATAFSSARRTVTPFTGL